MLGDITHDDTTYAGADTSNMLSLDYYRAKVGEFQSLLVALDNAAQSASASIDSAPDDEAAQLSALVSEYFGHREALVMAAEALNGVATVANATGIRFPVVSLPQGLGIAPVVAIAGAAAAIGVAAALVVWGKDWISRVYMVQTQAISTNASLQAAQAITDPTQRDAALSALATQQQALTDQAAKTQAALATASGSAIGQIAGIVKWGAIALLGWLGWRMFESMNHEKAGA